MYSEVNCLELRALEKNNYSKGNVRGKIAWFNLWGVDIVLWDKHFIHYLAWILPGIFEFLQNPHDVHIFFVENAIHSMAETKYDVYISWLMYSSL